MELKYTSRGPRLIEVNCRMGGGPVRLTNLLVRLGLGLGPESPSLVSCSFGRVLMCTLSAFRAPELMTGHVLTCCTALHTVASTALDLVVRTGPSLSWRKLVVKFCDVVLVMLRRCGAWT